MAENDQIYSIIEKKLIIFIVGVFQKNIKPMKGETNAKTAPVPQLSIVTYIYIVFFGLIRSW